MDKALPGTFLGTAGEFKVGTGVYEDKGKLYAGITGKVVVFASENGGKTLNIEPALTDSYAPKIGDIVYAVVTEITKTDAKVEILAQEKLSLRHGQKYNGLIRYEHMRDYEIDKIVVEECLLPGDIIKAKIVTLFPIHPPHNNH